MVMDGSADATDWREAETRLRQDRTPHLDRHLDQDSDLDVTLPTYHTTPPPYTQYGRVTQSASIGNPQRRHGQSCLAPPNFQVFLY
jgi:hypothetical protein